MHSWTFPFESRLNCGKDQRKHHVQGQGDPPLPGSLPSQVMSWLWRTRQQRSLGHGIIRSRRKSENIRSNISSVSTRSWNPKRRAVLFSDTIALSEANTPSRETRGANV